MKKIDVGQTLNTLANIGVIAGIIFLGIELRQNQTVGQAQNRTAITQAMVDLNKFDSTEMAGLLVRQTSGEMLSPEEEWRMGLWADSWLRVFENLHYQNRLGLFDESEFEGHASGIRRVVNEPGYLRDYFCESRWFFSPSFVSEVESQMSDPCD